MSETITLTAPTGVVREIEMAAAAEGLSVEAFIMRVAAQRAHDLVDAKAFFSERGARADGDAFDRIMNREGGEPPGPGDEVE